MCEPVTIMAAVSAATAIAGTATSAYGNYQQGKITREANEYQAQIDNNNAQIAQRNASYERQQGIEDARKIRIQSMQKMSAQKSAMASNGIDIYQGTPVDLLADTASMGELDALTSMYNSERRAMNYEQQGSDFSNQAIMSNLAGKNAFKSGIISGLGTGLQGASKVAGKWSNYNK